MKLLLAVTPFLTVTKLRRFGLLLASLASLVGTASGAVLFSDDFDADHTATWFVKKSSSVNDSDFSFDYSSVGIPSAPHSAGGSTYGLKLEANISGNINGGINVLPLGQSFTGDYILAFDYWGDFPGPFPAGGNGTTQLGLYGIGANGSTAQVPGAVIDSVWFAATLDCASSADYRACSSAAVSSYANGSAVYAAATRNNTDTYYAPLGNASAPTSQLTLYSGQTGSAAGMRWRRIEIAKIGGYATWMMDGLLLATVDLSTVTVAGSNFFLGHSDTNANSSTDPLARQLLFSLYDNVTVTAVPEPTSGRWVAVFGLIGAGNITCKLTNRWRRTQSR